MAMIMTYDSFLQKFKHDMRPYWTLYEGRTAKGKLLDSNLEIENMEESFEYLERVLGYYQDGTFTIVTRTSPNARNYYTVTVSMGAIQSKSQSIMGSSAMSLRGMPSFMDVWGITDNLRAKINTLEVQNSELRIKNERLEEQLENPQVGSTFDLLVNRLVENMPVILPGIMGQHAPPAPMQQHQGAAIGNTAEEKDNGHFSYDRAIQCMMAIKRLYPQYRVDLLMVKLVYWMNHNKPMADQFIHNLMKDEQRNSNTPKEGSTGTDSI